MTRNAMVLTAVALLLSLSACDNSDSKGTGDAPVGTQDRTPPEILVMPDEYPNVADKCDGHGHRVYVVTHNKNDVPPVVITDPSCPGPGR